MNRPDKSQPQSAIESNDQVDEALLYELDEMNSGVDPIESNDQVDEALLTKPQTDYTTKAASSSISLYQIRGFDWTALGVVILISAFFAITARLNAQPATS